MPRGSILAVLGGQNGSEGKGVIVNHLAKSYDIHVRVGAPNAGHSFVHEGRLWKMQSIPCGWTNPNATLVIGRGGLISPHILMDEITAIEKAGYSLKDRLFIDPLCGILDHHHHMEEGGVEGEIHQRIGSTGEGVGAARIARIRREPFEYRPGLSYDGAHGFRLFGDLVHDPTWSFLSDYLHRDTPGFIAERLEQGANVLLEGAQGVNLSLIHGPWPFVTSTDCGAAQLAADVGIPPRYVNRTLMVFRIYPIRVAGNSGPLDNELSWAEMSEKVGHAVEEHTTVTHKIRRIGGWDHELARRAVVLNAPTSLAVTFADYISPEDEGKVSYSGLSPKTRNFVDYVERSFDVPVALIGTGGEGFRVVDRGLKL